MSRTLPQEEMRAHGLSPELMNLPSPSFIFSILPSTVQGRLARVQSFRASNAYSTGSPRKSKSTLRGLTQRRHDSLDTDLTSGMQTPPHPPTYNSPVFAAQSANMEMALERTAYHSDQSSIVSDLDRPLPSDSRDIAGSTSESQTAIVWKFANQGLSLLGMSVSEASALSEDPKENDTTNAAFSRQLYIHGISYLLRALPPNLTADEEMSLRSALPQQLYPATQAPGSQPLISNEGPSEPSLLHKTLASTIIQLFLLVQFILPHLKLVVRNAYDYERTHHLSEKLFARSLDAFDVVGKRGSEIGERLSKLGDGRVGQVFNAILAWWFLGVVGGVCEGFGEGVRIVKERN